MHTENKTVEIKMVSKLSTKNAGISPKKIHALADDKDYLVLSRIIGIADGVKTIEDPVHGKVFYPLTGRFEAVHPETGAKTRSGVLYLPTGIHENYESAVRKLDEGDSIRFAIELRAVRSDNPAGYSYEAVDLLPVSEVDPLSEIVDALNRKSLPVAASEVMTPKAEEKSASTPVTAPVHNSKGAAQTGKR